MCLLSWNKAATFWRWVETGKAVPAGHGLVSNQGWGKWKREMVSRESQASRDVGQWWLLAPVEHNLCHLVTCVLPCGTQGGSSCLHFVLPCCSCTQHKPLLTHTPLLHSWRIVRSGDLSWGHRFSQGETFHKCQWQEPMGSVCAQTLEQGQEGSLCEQTGPEAVMTGFEDYPLAKVTDKICDWAGLCFLLDRVRGARALEKRVVVTPQSSLYVQV